MLIMFQSVAGWVIATPAVEDGGNLLIIDRSVLYFLISFLIMRDVSHQ